MWWLCRAKWIRWCKRIVRIDCLLLKLLRWWCCGTPLLLLWLLWRRSTPLLLLWLLWWRSTPSPTSDRRLCGRPPCSAGGRRVLLRSLSPALCLWHRRGCPHLRPRWLPPALRWFRSNMRCLRGEWGSRSRLRAVSTRCFSIPRAIPPRLLAIKHRRRAMESGNRSRVGSTMPPDNRFAVSPALIAAPTRNTALGWAAAWNTRLSLRGYRHWRADSLDRRPSRHGVGSRCVSGGDAIERKVEFIFIKGGAEDVFETRGLLKHLDR